jgi:hypothetical protein
MNRKNTGISLTTERMTKLNALAQELGVSRNETLGLLIEAAQVKSRPAVNVPLTRKSDGIRQDQPVAFAL